MSETVEQRKARAMDAIRRVYREDGVELTPEQEANVAGTLDEIAAQWAIERAPDGDGAFLHIGPYMIGRGDDGWFWLNSNSPYGKWEPQWFRTQEGAENEARTLINEAQDRLARQRRRNA